MHGLKFNRAAVVTSPGYEYITESQVWLDHVPHITI